jgi:hypothetical protein
MKWKSSLLFTICILTTLTSLPSYAAKLASKQVMKAQLISVLDESRVKSEYYPLLLKHAGSKKTPKQIVAMFDQETEKFLASFPPQESKLVRVQIVPYIVHFIKAIPPHSPKEAKQAIQIHLETQRPPRVVEGGESQSGDHSCSPQRFQLKFLSSGPKGNLFTTEA